LFRDIGAAAFEQRFTRRPVLALLNVPEVAALAALKEIDAWCVQKVIESNDLATAAFRAMGSC
jgi:hypothetical protein